MALEIDQRTINDFHIEFTPFWNRFWDHFGVHFGGPGLQKQAMELDPLMLGTLLAQFLVPRRLGCPTWTHFETILGAFWHRFRFV